MVLQKKTVDALGGLASTTVSTDDLSLEVVEGPHKGQSLHLVKEVNRIGRMDWCELGLSADPWVSNVHCECWLEEKGLRVHDLNSRNGIKINNIPVLDAYFVPGAQLQVGQSVLQLRSHHQKKELTIAYHDELGTLVGKSLAMRKIFHFLPRLGQRRVTTLLTGETGTGKTSIAQAIHLQHHQNRTAPFVVVNCGALPESLIAAALFGHEKGAFTGADKRHLGFFEQANGGTLFLDEIAELPLDLQPKFLDVLERRVIRRLGGETDHPVDFHLITATHRDLKAACEAGRFREDLFFRLSVVHLVVPPLRERQEDIPLLVETFLRELSPTNILYVTSALMQKLKEYLWPGNIRELKNVLERALIFHDGDTLDVGDVELSSQLSQGTSTPASFQPAIKLANQPTWAEDVFPTLPLSTHQPPVSLKDVLKNTEQFFITQALQETNFNAPEAAQLLSLSESWLYSRIKLYGLGSRRKRER